MQHLAPQGGPDQGPPAPPTQYYSCPCGYMVSRETYSRMMMRFDKRCAICEDDKEPCWECSIRQLRCPGCNKTWHFFGPTPPEDWPNDDDFSAKIVYFDEMVCHLQGEEEGKNNEATD